MKFEDIHIRDPFVLPADGKYYLYGSRCKNSGNFAFGGATGLDVYVSTDLENWSEPHECFSRPADFWSDRDFWAPEVHCWQEKYYMFVSFKAENACRGTQILKSEQGPMGPFLPISEGPVTPRNWECLDGTLYVDKQGKPWMVFCHEWVQIGNGTVCALPLKEDLTAPAGEPIELFHAVDAPWVRDYPSKGNFVTDGPFIYRARNGQLRMIWSSFNEKGAYAQGLACSESGEITGPWTQAEQPIMAADSGHGMLFRDYEEKLYLILHAPNEGPLERPKLFPMRETDEGFERA